MTTPPKQVSSLDNIKLPKLTLECNILTPLSPRKHLPNIRRPLGMAKRQNVYRSLPTIGEESTQFECSEALPGASSNSDEFRAPISIYPESETSNSDFDTVINNFGKPSIDMPCISNLYYNSNVSPLKFGRIIGENKACGSLPNASQNLGSDKLVSSKTSARPSWNERDASTKARKIDVNSAPWNYPSSLPQKKQDETANQQTNQKRSASTYS